MNTATPVAFVGLLALCGGWLAMRSGEDHAASAPASVAASVKKTTAAPSVTGAGDSDDDSDLDAPDPTASGEPLPTTDAGLTMPNGKPVPDLQDAPKSVRFGVVLIQYKGAQGAKRDARSKDDAYKLAATLRAEAVEDFEAAAKKGDPGSVAKAGRMYRGVLEPAPEFALFSLKKGEVSEPIDTPRGLWVMKRHK